MAIEIIIVLGIVALVIWLIVRANRNREPESWEDREKAIRAELRLEHKEELQELKDEFRDSKKDIQQKSVSSSRRSLVGKFIEKFIPFLSNVPYEPSDMHFLGAPIDYIVFEGLHQDDITNITFLEVKTGKSKLTKREESLKRAIQNKKVSWKQINIPVDNEPIKGMENRDISN